MFLENSQVTDHFRSLLTDASFDSINIYWMFVLYRALQLGIEDSELTWALVLEVVSSWVRDTLQLIVNFNSSFSPSHVLPWSRLPPGVVSSTGPRTAGLFGLWLRLDANVSATIWSSTAGYVGAACISIH